MPLGSRQDFADARFAGVFVPYKANVEYSVHQAESLGFDFIVAPLTDPSYRPNEGNNRNSDGSLQPPMLPGHVLHTLSSGAISNQIVGVVSDWIDLDSADPSVRKMSANVMKRELEWASHLTTQACIVPYPEHLHSPNYAQCINLFVSDPSFAMTLWMHAPLCDDDSMIDREDPWEVWNSLRFLCEHSRKLGIILELGETLPCRESTERWWGEPIRALLINTERFSKNERGYPILSNGHVNFVIRAMQMGVQVVIDARSIWGDSSRSGGEWPCISELTSSLPSNQLIPPPPPVSPIDTMNVVSYGDKESSGVEAVRGYWGYISYLLRKQPPLDETEILEIPYRDFLQAPLQPLQDNLESQTYETFERDRPKYEAYQAAIEYALREYNPYAPEEQIVLMVVGAGRGPLVAAAISASEAAKRNVFIIAVEKNPNAVVHLHARAQSEGWLGKVEIVHADMRDWQPKILADILVSELLGSFGDNELSPECLDGAQRFLKENGISIPSSYTSYLSPITAHKVWTEASSHDALKQFETPFVVKLFRYQEIDASRPVFTFRHPNFEDIIDNDRFTTLEFQNHRQTGVVCHGFAGYFEAILYKGIHLSIKPDTHTHNMHSWFPIYFPIRTPCYIPPSTKISASMWRRSDRTKVWYEWCLNEPVTSPIHNPNGRSYHVGL